MSEKRSGSYWSGQSYGEVRYDIHEDQWGCTIYVAEFGIHSLPKGLTDREAEIAVRGFVEGHDRGVRSIQKPENALKQIARHQYDEKRKRENEQKTVSGSQ